MSDPSFAEALRCFRTGRLAEAAAICGQLRARNPDDFDACHLGGVIAEGQGDLALATALIACAVGKRPGEVEARRNLGALLARQGKVPEAVAQFDAAHRLRPRDVALLNDLARAKSDNGDGPGAIDAWRASLALDADQPAIQIALGIACQNAGRIEESETAYRRATELAPERADAWVRLGHALSILCRPEEAQACYQKAQARGGGAGAEVMAAAMLCPLERSVADMERRRTALSESIADLTRRRVALRDPLVEVGLTNFYLAYHGRDDRRINETVARFYSQACPDLNWTAAHVPGWRERPSRPRYRIGFLSSFFYSHSTGKALRGLIERRDRGRWEAVLFRFGGPRDAVSTALAKAVDKVVELPRNLAAARPMLAREELDLLVHADIAADPIGYFLAFARIAPVQITTWGHADTSGVPAVDYYVSARDWEPPEGESHYSERLIRLAHLPTCFSRPAAEPSAIGRTDLGLPVGVPFYLCPHNVIKFHPEFDRLLADLLRRDERAILAIPEGHVVAWTERLRLRLADACGRDFARVRILPRLRHRDFLASLRLADALLDPIHFCGGITSLEAFALGCPIVTLPGRFMRGRMTLGFYRRMGHFDLIAADARNYVEIAYRLANDPAWRERQRAEIASRSAVLFDDIGAVSEFESFMAAALNAARHGRNLDEWPLQGVS